MHYAQIATGELFKGVANDVCVHRELDNYKVTRRLCFPPAENTCKSNITTEKPSQSHRIDQECCTHRLKISGH